jgi:hypothetical protein
MREEAFSSRVNCSFTCTSATKHFFASASLGLYIKVGGGERANNDFIAADEQSLFSPASFEFYSPQHTAALMLMLDFNIH